MGQALVDAEAVAEAPGLADGTVPMAPVQFGEDKRYRDRQVRVVNAR